MMSTRTEKSNIKLIECPRDAMQGLSYFVPTAVKTEYLNLLLQVGFDTLDFGSFVSPKVIPQMRDTDEVLANLELDNTKTNLLAIVANQKGAEKACKYPEIKYLGFPFSISETFQKRNTNSSIQQSLHTVEELLSAGYKHNKKAVIYLSMGFGNPYMDEWNVEILQHWTHQLVEKGVEIISIADTIGISTPESIKLCYASLRDNFKGIEFGLHLHSTPQQRDEKIAAAFEVNCHRIDSALSGFGGCPMAEDHLTGNIATENIIDYLTKNLYPLALNLEKWKEAVQFSKKIFHK